MATTQYRGYPLVADGDAPDGQAQINALANAVDQDVAELSAGLRQGATIYYTSSDTFMKGLYPGLKAITVECIGGGGGSGYLLATDSSHVSAGAGGAGGAYVLAQLTDGDLLSAEDVTVGPGGAGGTSGSHTGDAGGTSEFGTHCSAGGGYGGDSDTADYTSGAISALRGAGGAPSGTRQIGISGEGYGAVTSQPNSIVPAVAGILDHTGMHGGRAGGPYGQANIPANAITSFVDVANVVPSAGVGPGSGAGGGFNAPSSSASDGAAGADGLVIITVYY